MIGRPLHHRALIQRNATATPRRSPFSMSTGKDVPLMNSTHKVETLEISDNDLDNVSGGLLGHIVGNVLGTVTGTVDSVVPVSGALGSVTGLVSGL
jgi:hypothetical protein